jgi:hypothetical protein
MMMENAGNALAAALAKAQGEMKNAGLNKVNPHFKSKYADLPTIRDAVTGVLSKHGLAIAQFTRCGEHGTVLVTRLMHADGGVIDGEFPLPNLSRPAAEEGSAHQLRQGGTRSPPCAGSQPKRTTTRSRPQHGSRQRRTEGRHGAPPHATAPKAQPPQQPATAPEPANGKRALDWPSVQARNVPKDLMAETLASGMSECIRMAEDAGELAQLEQENKTALDWLAKAVPAGHAQIKRQIAARLDEIANGPNAMAGI